VYYLFFIRRVHLVTPRGAGHEELLVASEDTTYSYQSELMVSKIRGNHQREEGSSLFAGKFAVVRRA
jgi:hypothetical protein